MTRAGGKWGPRRLDLWGGDGPLLVELLHPGPGLGFAGPHRRIEGGVLTDDGALLVVPGLLALAPDGRDLVLARRESPGSVALLRWRGGRLEGLRSLSCSGLHLGATWLVAWQGTSAWAEQVEDGTPVRLPLGALEARARPWPAGAGATWRLGRSAVEQQGQGAPRTVGVAGAALRRLVPGPGGALVAEGRDGTTWVRARGSGLRPAQLDGPPGEVAFAADGRQALVEEPAGVSLVDLATGELRDHRPEGRPADFGWWLEPGGGRLRWRQEYAELTLPGPGARLGDQLHGPGGLAWDLRTGRALGTALTAGADLATAWGRHALVVDGQQLLLDGDALLFELPDDQTALELAAGPELAAVRTDGGVAWGQAHPGSWRWQALAPPSAGPLLAVQDGRLLVGAASGPLALPDLSPAGRLADPPAPPALARALGLPLDGAFVAPDGSTWAWQEDGPLLRLRRPA